MNDIIFCVQNDVTQKEYMEHEEYNVKAAEFGFNAINLRSWHYGGAPRVEQAVFDKLNALKKEINDLCVETKDKMNNGGRF